MNSHSGDMPTITAEHRVALYDEKVSIKLTNFQAGEEVTLHGEVVKGKKNPVIFASCAHYVADSNGSVCVEEQPSTGGTYTGTESMGIVWSLKPAPGYPFYSRMVMNFTDQPTLMELKTYKGHLRLEDIYDSSTCPNSVASIQLERWFKSPGVTRVEVEAGNVRGALYLPEGDGPFQGVIDLFGMTGGIIEYRAALLASRGFAALVLPYFGYKDLTKDLSEVTMDYFEEAIAYLSTHPKVFRHGIGLIGQCKGAEFCYAMSVLFPQVKCLVSVNGLPYPGVADLYYKGNLFMKSSPLQHSLVKISDEGAITQICRVFDDNLFPVWKNDTKCLLIISEDDFSVDPDCHKLLLDSCPEEKKSNCHVLRYPGAGHFIEAPYMPLSRSARNPHYDLVLLFGGDPKQHAKAQDDAWPRILKFLQENIPIV